MFGRNLMLFGSDQIIFGENKLELVGTFSSHQFYLAGNKILVDVGTKLMYYNFNSESMKTICVFNKT